MPPEDTALIPRRLRSLEIGQRKLTDCMVENTARLDDVVARLDAMHLNGHASAILTLADASADLVQLRTLVPQLVGIVREREDDDAFVRELKRRVHWNNGTREVVRIIVSSIVVVACYIVAKRLGLPHP